MNVGLDVALGWVGRARRRPDTISLDRACFSTTHRLGRHRAWHRAEPGARRAGRSQVGGIPPRAAGRGCGEGGRVSELPDAHRRRGKGDPELGPGKRLDVLRAARRDGARRCVAVDIVPYRDPEPGIEYRIYDGRSLPFGDAEFDVVWSWSVFEHLRWPAITLGEVARVLRPDGVMIARIDLRDHYALRPGPWREREEWLNCLRYPAWLWWL